MDYKTLQVDIRNGDLKPVYLLYGEERYLVTHYADALGADSDRETFDGNVPPQQIKLAADALPFLAEKRVVYVRDSKLFVNGRKNDAETLADYIPHIPPETILIFIETEADKRLKLYKAVAKEGRAIECTPLPPPELNRWVVKKFTDRGKTITPNAAEALMRTTAYSMTALANEIDKLAAYAGKRPGITIEDVDALCTATTQTKVFDMLAAMGRGDTARALQLYANMLYMKESPHGILSMVTRQFRIILLCKEAQNKKMPKADMAKALGLHPFAVSEALAQAGRYSTHKLLAAMVDCADTDVRMKSGRMDAELGVELLIVKYSVK
ncbi:MAG: DNA polymerase III subunit delta [Defluviitaleaceae bacterium]|nr:DNA polymerase III subunit delta [Defluviitaleaceae bacterium]